MRLFATFSMKSFQSHHFRCVCPLTPLGPQSRFGDKPLKFQVICPQLSPKRDCSAIIKGLRMPLGWVVNRSFTPVAQQVTPSQQWAALSHVLMRGALSYPRCGVWCGVSYECCVSSGARHVRTACKKTIFQY